MWINLVVFELEAIADVMDRAPREVFGMGVALRRLKAADIALGIITGLPRHAALHTLRVLGWTELVDACVTQDDGARAAPHPDMVLCVMNALGIGHGACVVTVAGSPLGVLQGATAGCAIVIGVSGRGHEADALRRAPCTQIVGTPALVPEVLRRIARLRPGAAGDYV
jgi:beta-phosphoglucomutase-like phosphatase (HAD superfamily)